MSGDAGGRARKSKLLPRGRRLHIPGSRRDTAVVLALILAALAVVWLVLKVGRRDGRGAASARRQVPGSVIPRRIPYGELVRGKARELPDGRVEILYDFERAKAAAGGGNESEDEVYPQLDDWNWSIGRPGEESGIIRGGGRFLGQARTRLGFFGPVEVATEVEVRGHAVAVQVGTDTGGYGYECVVHATGAVKLRLRRAKKDGTNGRREAEVTDLAGPAKIVPAKAASQPLRVALVFTKSNDALAVKVNGKELLTAPLPSPDPFPEGNVALRSVGAPALWDDVKITGRLCLKTIRDRMGVAIETTPRDAFEPDDTRTTARELLVGGGAGVRAGDGDGKGAAYVQERTLKPEGDVDWVSIAVPDIHGDIHGKDGAAPLLRVEVSGVRLGMTAILAAFAPEATDPAAGLARLDAWPVPTGEAGGAAILVNMRELDLDTCRLIYVRVSEPEGRAGSYRLRAEAVGGRGGD